MSDQPSNPTASRWSQFCARPAGLLAVWALALLMAMAGMAIRGMDPVGPDDVMRMLEVRDLLNGQSWFDVNQYRVDPPDGASMHWSRLVDIPLAIGFALLGEDLTMAIVPMLWLLAAMFALRAIMQKMGVNPIAMLAGLVTLTFYPMVVTQFMPMRIDHHGPQAALGLWAVALLLRDSAKTAFVSGVLCAAWIAISLEALPLIAAIAAVFGLLYWREGDQRLKYMLAGLALAAPLFSYATRPSSAFSLPFCDILAPGHMLAFAASALLAFALPFFPGQDRAKGRFLALIAFPIVCAPAALFGLGECATNPMGQLDPLVRDYWYNAIPEGLPIWKQSASTAAVQIWTLGVLVFGWRFSRKEWASKVEIAKTLQIGPADVAALIGLLACLYSFAVMRASVFAQLLALPFAALLLAHFMPRARAIASSLPRILATLACLALVTPVMIGAAAERIVPAQRASEAQVETLQASAAVSAQMPECDVSRLAAFEPGLVFSTLDLGPEILDKSAHTIIAASYHRNDQAMGDIIRAFISGQEDARQIIQQSGADYLAICTLKDDIWLYRGAAPGNFADMLSRGEAPDWLEAVEGFEEGGLQLYRPR